MILRSISFLGFGVKGVKAGSSGALRFCFAHFASCAHALTGKHEPHRKSGTFKRLDVEE